MVVRRLAIFSGFDTNVVEACRIRLQSNQTHVAFVRRPESLDARYFDSLLGRSLFQVDRLRLPTERVHALLVSCVEDLQELALETAAFFPSVQRLGLRRQWRKDINATSQICRSVLQTLTSPVFRDSQELVRHTGSAMALLPLVNVPSRRLTYEIRAIYEMQSRDFTARIAKEVVRLKRGQGIRVGSLTFRSCVNDPSHPIRRQSNKPHCDLSASLRLGFDVPARLEFDVTCDSGLDRKTFCQCDGRSETVPSGTSHLNMRINGDFECG